MVDVTTLPYAVPSAIPLSPPYLSPFSQPTSVIAPLSDALSRDHGPQAAHFCPPSPFQLPSASSLHSVTDDDAYTMALSLGPTDLLTS